MGTYGDKAPEEQPAKENEDKGKKVDKEGASATGDDSMSRLKSLEKEYMANQHALASASALPQHIKQNKTKEMMKELESEELGKELQSNEMLLKGEEKVSHGTTTSASDEKEHTEKNEAKSISSKSNTEIEAENKVILTKIMDLIHQIK